MSAAASAAPLLLSAGGSFNINGSQNTGPPSVADANAATGGSAPTEAAFRQVYSFGSDQHATDKPLEDSEHHLQDPQVSGFSTVYTYSALELQHSAAADGVAAALSTLFHPVYLHRVLTAHLCSGHGQTWQLIYPEDALATLFTPVYHAGTEQTTTGGSASTLMAQPMVASAAATHPLLRPSTSRAEHEAAGIERGSQQARDMAGTLAHSLGAISHSGLSSSNSQHWAPFALVHDYSSRRSIDDLQLGSKHDCLTDANTVYLRA